MNKFHFHFQVMKELRHNKLVQLFAVCTMEEPFLIITEYMCNGSLHNYLQKPEGEWGYLWSLQRTSHL